MKVKIIECIGFAQGTVRQFDFWNVFNKGLYGVHIF